MREPDEAQTFLPPPGAGAWPLHSHPARDVQLSRPSAGLASPPPSHSQNETPQLAPLFMPARLQLAQVAQDAKAGLDD